MLKNHTTAKRACVGPSRVGLWGQASVSAVFARVWHLTRSRPLTDAAGANRGQARSTHSLAIQPAEQADVSVLPPQS